LAISLSYTTTPHTDVRTGVCVWAQVTGIDWRQKLETQRGAVIATELKNNSNKLAKWTVASLLAGADQMKLGYVTRSHVRDNLNHVILGTQFYKPKDFALQVWPPAWAQWTTRVLQANCRSHRPQKLKCLISLLPIRYRF
jgi:hypothetical protein